MGTATGDQDSSYWRTAGQAGFASSQVDAMLDLKESPDAVGIHVVGYGGPP